jgi:hypothetical protein
MAQSDAATTERIVEKFTMRFVSMGSVDKPDEPVKRTRNAELEMGKSERLNECGSQEARRLKMGLLV